MSNTVVSQGHKVIIDGGGITPGVVSQAHKVVMLTTGSVPSHVSQGHKVFLITPTTGRRRGFMSWTP